MKHKVIINHWEETCEDDSCYEYGTSIIVDGKELIREASITSALKSVLKEIGADVEIEETVESEKKCDSYKK
ncbi:MULTISPECIES: hypothetical protein [Bacillus]|uniref:Uncharacterized protein n=1 Tax=Bacillus amyloliquefaciens (strain ATCC 23350 / DSM 7 / BCRC 11601 / CCUG 28519 / NBRC 15535 / NRRL B-14393 / F) TaxID=692420 RepID=A0A9P1JH15_BACAS|nr:hypothetical protein [Bacillus amyloliquefaciens]AIW33732.1 hypothetical protein KS08_08795 [Bacillus subtilis]AEB23862.1 hypothetical protein BAMTA208_08455 [Bacillus amyloliquefaciens TA208]AEB63436.1 hypothetical protein LL3_01896 [Bacillus amyloliquefaciens LL3]AEK88857.1 hypothetical protein BAXH7_01723 [Bacillus amyloliquefaciens XH7]ARW39010.1 uncharacterized protein S101267_01922 [Bacillus amyloliquefaciens]